MNENLPAENQAAPPLWLPIPDQDHDGDNPVGRLEKDEEEEEEKPPSDIPLQSDNPWPRRRL